HPRWVAEHRAHRAAAGGAAAAFALGTERTDRTDRADRAGRRTGSARTRSRTALTDLGALGQPQRAAARAGPAPLLDLAPVDADRLPGHVHRSPDRPVGRHTS